MASTVSSTRSQRRVNADAAVPSRNGTQLVPPLPRHQHLRTVILGAGIAGNLVLNELRRHPHLGYVPVGFLDDDPRKQRRAVGGLPVWGTLAGLPSAVKRHRVQLALLAMPSAPGRLHRRMTLLARRVGVELRVVPGYYEVLQHDTTAGRVRPINLEDLFRRPPASFDLGVMHQTLTGKTMMITGAAGSIGHELCRQLARFQPRQLVLFDHEENNLYETYLALHELHPMLPLHVAVGDIRDRTRIRSVLRTYRPEVLYHAAAYKHVPVMELSVLEAIKTNILGTAVLVEEAGRSGVGRFVLISTDKAVNPTSVMGACKRFAEQVVQSAAPRFPGTALMVVRFGNVIASRGNVIERFTQQIARGGPVTITHPAMERYFMTREEAAQLVMQASAWGRGGEVFILNMGRQIKLVQVAREMIRLAGLQPGTDIPLVFTGIRPGEKLREKLITTHERSHSTNHRRIRVVRSPSPSWRVTQQALQAFRRAARSEEDRRGRQLLERYVAAYREPRHG